MAGHILATALRAGRLLREAYARYTREIALVTLLSVVAGILEGIGVNAIIPLFSFVGGQQHTATDAISGVIQRIFAFLQIDYSAKYLLIFIVFLFVAKALFLFASKYINLRIMVAYELEARRTLFRRLLESTWLHLRVQKVGFVDQVLITDISRSSGILFHMGLLVVVLISIVVYSILAITISPAIAVIALFFGGCVLVIFKPLFAKYRVLSDKINKKYKIVGHFINEHLIGMKVVKTSVAEEGVAAKGYGFIDALRTLRVRGEVIRNITDIALQPLGVLFITGLFAFLFKAGTFDFPSFVVIVYAVNRVFTNIQQIQAEVHDINSRIPHLLSVMQFEKEALMHQEELRGRTPFAFEHSLDFTDVSFSYAAEGVALSKVTFSVRKGEMLGIIGPSGSGKTTLVDLLLRLLTPATGTITLDGKSSADFALHAWRAKVGYVPQEVFLLNDTIENNIRFYDVSVSQAAMVAAARQAHILEFIEQQSEGWQTRVGERGTRLSGGERQRIALARSLARKPQILILDEATSALDAESEQFIKKSLEELKGKITIIIIAHRLSTITGVDRLVVLENGALTEAGKPDELLKDKDSYFFKVFNLISDA